MRNRPFATNDHMVQKIRHAGGQAHYYSRTGTSKQRQVKLHWFRSSGLFVLMSQSGNSNELALQHGGFFLPCDPLLQKAYYHIFGKRKPYHSNSLNSLYLLERRSLRSTGPFLERLGNSSGRKSNS